MIHKAEAPMELVGPHKSKSSTRHGRGSTKSHQESHSHDALGDIMANTGPGYSMRLPSRSSDHKAYSKASSRLALQCRQKVSRSMKQTL